MVKFVRNIGVFLFLMASTVVALSQSDPQFSFNRYNHLTVNPGYAGINQVICATAIHRQQWIGFEGHPVSTVFNLSGYLRKISSGIGLSVLSDNIGFQKNVGLHLNYSYQLELADGLLGIGLGMGFLNVGFTGTDGFVTPSSLEGTGVVANDPAIPKDGTHTSFDADMGAFYASDQFFVGLSSTHLTQPTITTDKKAFLKRHYYLVAGYNYQMPNPLLEVRPTLMVKSDGVVNQYSMTALLLYNKTFWGGLGYRLADAVILQVGWIAKNNLRVGVAYEITTSDIGAYSSNSMEIMLNYCFSVSGGGRGRYGSVRFL
jgi:type IX secretion system PorP/SprF family membrane protein